MTHMKRPRGINTDELYLYPTALTLVNIAVVTATLPFTGLPLPFISFGGSSLVISLVGVGILLNISQGGEGEESATFDFGWRHRRPHLSRPGRG